MTHLYKRYPPRNTYNKMSEIIYTIICLCGLAFGVSLGAIIQHHKNAVPTQRLNDLLESLRCAFLKIERLEDEIKYTQRVFLKSCNNVGHNDYGTKAHTLRLPIVNDDDSDEWHGNSTTPTLF